MGAWGNKHRRIDTLVAPKAREGLVEVEVADRHAVGGARPAAIRFRFARRRCSKQCEGLGNGPGGALMRFVDAIPAHVYAASGMMRVDPERRVAGRAFVPVGRGHAPAVPFPRGGVMILGQDFGNERNLDDVAKAGEETDDVPTWGTII